MFGWKRPPLAGLEPSLYKRKRLTSLNTVWDGYQTHTCDTAEQHVTLQSIYKPEALEIGRTDDLSEEISSWADTQNSVKKVLDHLKSKQATGEFFLDDTVNQKFGEFHRNITDECGAEDKQHSWAVLEKKEAIIMYGPYYPRYSRGEHSEDIIIKQTQELLESEGDPEDWKVYIFTMNSPCLARNTNPCMLKLVHKAQEWWRLYGVKTHIGFVRCWGFKGNKENVFKDLSYRQVECINQSEDFESYVKTAEKTLTDVNPLCETVFRVAEHLLKSGRVDKFPLTTTVQRQDRRSYGKSMHAQFESKPEEERKILTREVGRVTEAAEVLLSGQIGSLEEYLERGGEFILGYSFASQLCDPLQDEMRLAFQQCWTEMVQDMYAEFIREKLTEDFNHYAVQLFIRDVLKVTAGCLQIGKVELSEEDPSSKNTPKDEDEPKRQNI